MISPYTKALQGHLTPNVMCSRIWSAIGLLIWMFVTALYNETRLSANRRVEVQYHLSMQKNKP